jgi:hypothetical protein
MKIEEKGSQIINDDSALSFHWLFISYAHLP